MSILLRLFFDEFHFIKKKSRAEEKGENGFPSPMKKTGGTKTEFLPNIQGMGKAYL